MVSQELRHPFDVTEGAGHGVAQIEPVPAQRPVRQPARTRLLQFVRLPRPRGAIRRPARLRDLEGARAVKRERLRSGVRILQMIAACSPGALPVQDQQEPGVHGRVEVDQGRRSRLPLRVPHRRGRGAPEGLQLHDGLGHRGVVLRHLRRRIGRVRPGRGAGLQRERDAEPAGRGDARAQFRRIPKRPARRSGPWPPPRRS